MISLDFLGALAPLGVDLLLAVGILSLLAADLILPAGDKPVLGWGALGTLVAALVGTFIFDLQGEALSGAYVGDGLALVFKQVALLGGIVAFFAGQAHVAEHWGRRHGEYFLLCLFSILGMSLLAGARDLVFLLVAFELMGIPLYILAAFGKTRRGVEGAFKLYLTGAISSAITLYGASFLFGLSGTTSLAGIGEYMGTNLSAGSIVAIGLTAAGMGFKLGVYPFHMWLPDTYEGSPTPFVVFISAAPKAAGIVAMVQVLYAAQGALLAQVSSVLVVLIAVTLVMGNLFALNQSNIKRLLAYSGVAHSGFLLMALLCGDAMGLASLGFYLFGYLFTNAGIFMVVHAVQGAGGDDSVGSFAGLVRRSGWLSFSMLIFLLSLAGIPFVVGFWAKLFVFMAAWQAGFGGLVLLGAVLSVVGLFYYLRVARQMFMVPAAAGAGPIVVEPLTRVGIVLCLVAVVGMGVYPRPFVDAVLGAAQAYVGG